MYTYNYSYIYISATAPYLILLHHILDYLYLYLPVLPWSSSIKFVFYYYLYLHVHLPLFFVPLGTSVVDKEEGVRVLPEGSVHVAIYRENHMYRYYWDARVSMRERVKVRLIKTKKLAFDQHHYTGGTRDRLGASLGCVRPSSFLSLPPQALPSEKTLRSPRCRGSCRVGTMPATATTTLPYLTRLAFSSDMLTRIRAHQPCPQTRPFS